MTELRYKILGRNRLKDLQPPSYLIPRILPEQGLVTLVAEPIQQEIVSSSPYGVLCGYWNTFL